MGNECFIPLLSYMKGATSGRSRKCLSFCKNMSFVDRCLSFCTFSFGHCVVCSSIYGFWLPIWYLQTLLTFVFSGVRVVQSLVFCVLCCPSLFVFLSTFGYCIVCFSWGLLINTMVSSNFLLGMFHLIPGGLLYWYVKPKYM